MNPVLLTADDARAIRSLGPGIHHLQLSCTSVTVKVDSRRIEIAGQTLPVSELDRAKKTNVFYIATDGRLTEARVFTDHFYKLVPTGGFPALEIDGVRMHRSKDMFPEEEAKLKVDLLEPVLGQQVLDICTGLGYCAQELALRGCLVLSLEKSPEVVELARMNPCSQPFFEYLRSTTIRLVLCDAARFVSLLPSGYFDRVIHDPPTFSLAGVLYSLSFYTELRRVLKPDGLLLHYTGQPGSRYRRLSLKRGVSERLRQAGFATRWEARSRSVIARPIKQALRRAKAGGGRHDHKG